MSAAIFDSCRNHLKQAAGAAHVLISVAYGTVWTLAHGARADLTIPLDKPVLVMGNGPSLNDIDLPAVAAAGIELACVNFFPTRNDAFWSLRPSYLTLIDPAFFTHTPEVDQLWDALKKVTWPMRVLIPQGNQPPIQNDQLHFELLSDFILPGDALPGLRDRLYRRNLATAGFRNVTIGTGGYFISRRVPHLYYAGIDMSEFKQLFVDEENRIYVDTIHSYGTNRRYQTSVAPGQFYRVLDMYQTMFAQFYQLAQYALRQGVPVTNLSVNSYVDVFEKSRQFHKNPESR